MNKPNPYIHRLVQQVLKHRAEFKWTLQGFGMLRTHFDGDMRMNIWDDRFAVPGIIDSSVHDHPWRFESYVVAGRVRNVRYEIVTKDNQEMGDTSYNMQSIKTGVSGAVFGPIEPVILAAFPTESYSAGQKYSQEADEIHLSMPDRHTITINDREYKTDRTTARVFWRGEKWITAAPREASDQERDEIIDSVLREHF